MHATLTTIVGNVVADPRSVVTPQGHSLTSFRVASTERRFDRAAGEWRDGDTLFANVTCWRAMADHVAMSLRRGAPVIVYGRLSTHQYEGKDGVLRTSVDIDPISVGIDLSRVVCTIKRLERERPADDGSQQDNEVQETVSEENLAEDRAAEIDIADELLAADDDSPAADPAVDVAEAVRSADQTTDGGSRVLAGLGGRRSRG